MFVAKSRRMVAHSEQEELLVSQLFPKVRTLPFTYFFLGECFFYAM